MRDGRYVGSREASQCTERDLVAMMVGREITNTTSRPPVRAEEECLRVEGFSRRGVFSEVGFSARKGEILGLSGLVGSGRTELARAVFGMDPRDSGRVFINGRPVRISDTPDAIRAGLAYLTEDRKELGLYLNKPIRDNLIAPTLRRFSGFFGFMLNKPINSFASQKIREFSIATPSPLKKVGKLSGGNQQKCLVATWVGTDPRIIFLDEPTRGVDVASREDIYVKIEELAARGVSVVLISSDLPELIRLSDRILVMHHGKIAGEVARADFSEELILSYATGLQSGRTEEHRSHG
jgi:ABC-type sugar transport system ATPase subunit